MTLDFNPNHDPSNGQFTSGGGSGKNISEKPLTSEEESGKIQSFPKVIGKNGGTLQAEDIPQVLVKGYGKCSLVSGSKVDKIYNFAGKGTNRKVDIESGLIKRFGGKPGEWQHTTGNGEINYNGTSRKAEIHWFQEASVGIKLPRVKRWIK